MHGLGWRCSWGCRHADARRAVPGAPRSECFSAKANARRTPLRLGWGQAPSQDALVNGGRSGRPSLQDIRLPGNRYVMQVGTGLSAVQAAAVSVASVRLVGPTADFVLAHTDYVRSAEGTHQLPCKHASKAAPPVAPLRLFPSERNGDK